MTQFRKKPVVIEAVQWTGHSVDMDEFYRDWHWHDGGPAMEIKTLEGVMVGEVGDWIIKGVQGEFYPCKPDIFEQTYDPVG